MFTSLSCDFLQRSRLVISSCIVLPIFVKGISICKESTFWVLPRIKDRNIYRPKNTATTPHLSSSQTWLIKTKLRKKDVPRISEQRINFKSLFLDSCTFVASHLDPSAVFSFINVSASCDEHLRHLLWQLSYFCHWILSILFPRRIYYHSLIFLHIENPWSL